ncbi:MAG TPA: hypothetical protein VMM18_01670 [Gemmatimonadaceae bacterium]|nr:hypothetical protein [Gemmatimonadaceae bacterium]
MSDMFTPPAAIHTRLVNRRCAMLLAGALALAACDAATDPRIALEPGFLQLRWSGAIEDSLEVLGSLRTDGSAVLRQPYVAAGPHERFPGAKLTLVGFQPRGLAGGVYLALSIPDVDAGATLAIDRDCAGADCSSMLLLFGVGPQAPLDQLAPPPSRTCWIESGTLSITARTGSRVTGTFTGVGACIGDPAEPAQAFMVEQGAFSAPVSFGFRPRVSIG